LEFRVARFFSVQNTKLGGNIPKEHKLLIPKDHKLRTPNDHKLYPKTIKYTNVFHLRALVHFEFLFTYIKEKSVYQLAKLKSMKFELRDTYS
jgi:hypothetical protein